MSGGVPAGWVLVPEVATAKMTEAYEDCYGFYPDGPPFELAWATVLSATPPPPIEGRDADVERVREALTPSSGTKAAYHGEFTFDLCVGISDAGIEQYQKVYVPWDTVKEIMAAIRARAALQALGERG